MVGMINNESYYYKKAKKNLLSLEIEVQKVKSELYGIEMDIMRIYSIKFGPKGINKILNELHDYCSLISNDIRPKYGKLLDSYLDKYDMLDRELSDLKYGLKHFRICDDMERLGYHYDSDIYGLSEEPIYKW